MVKTKMIYIYKCPVCNLQLTKCDKQFTCEKRHSFDISSGNHVNLLLANQKKTKDPGDNREMMENRRVFLDKGYYEDFSNRLNEIIASKLESNAENLLDAGCGEGYFLSRLKNKLASEGREINYYGSDISKSAIKYATKRDKEINFSIASNFNMPFVDKSLDCIIRNFAPSEDLELSRVLKDDGILIVVTPGVRHLFELKKNIYETPRLNEEKIEEIKGFNLKDCIEVEYTIELDNNEDIQNLITMTPYYWTITGEMKAKLNALTAFATSLHFKINIFRKE